jgi:hypothetical protein
VGIPSSGVNQVQRSTASKTTQQKKTQTQQSSTGTSDGPPEFDTYPSTTP